jgi:hypothetical protein
MSDKVYLFSKIKERCNSSITLGDKGKFKILGVGKVGKEPSKVIDNVYMVKGLNFKLAKCASIMR